MYSDPLYKSCQPCPWGPYRPRPGGVMGQNIYKSSSPKPNGPEPSNVAMCSGFVYKSCQSCSKMAPPRGSLAPIDLQWEKHKKNLLLRNHKAQSFHILSVAMYSGPLYKYCKPCPWGLYRPRLGGGGHG